MGRASRTIGYELDAFDLNHHSILPLCYDRSVDPRIASEVARQDKLSCADTPWLCTMLVEYSRVVCAHPHRTRPRPSHSDIANARMVQHPVALCVGGWPDHVPCHA